MTLQNRTVFCRDNLDVMREMDDQSISLVYIDPPFHTNRIHEAHENSEASGAQFNDTWKDDDIDDESIHFVQQHYPSLYKIIKSVGKTHSRSMFNYLIYLTVRLSEVERITKNTGNIYLHCDPNASHYLKIVMDGIFGSKNFRNEIIWKRNVGTNKGNQFESRKFARNVDTLLKYSKTDFFFHKEIKRNLSIGEIIDKFPLIDDNGRRYNTSSTLFRSPSMGERPSLCYEYNGVTNPYSSGWLFTKEKLEDLDKNGYIIWREGKRPLRKMYADEYEGLSTPNLWEDIPIELRTESVGYPTQKPVKLLERIIKASTSSGDFVFDPFCGSGTTCVAAERLQRQWAAVDASVRAVDIVSKRMESEIGLLGEVTCIHEESDEIEF